jgi:tRNA (guanosine-2'-O-)-methyltransferase
VTRNLTSTDLKRLHREWRRKPHGRLAVYLDSVETPANVGSILRTAAAMGIGDVYLGGRTVEPSHPGAQRTAMGSERFVTLHRVDDPTSGLAAPRAAGYRLVGLELAEGAQPLHEVVLTGDLCLVVGHEDRGLSKASLEALDELAFIPQLGRIGSLNVAVATAIAFAEARRQTWTAAGEPG